MAPGTFGGLPWLEAALHEALAHARGHALLIHGPRGVGQFELAQALAAAWLCEQPGQSDPPTPAAGPASVLSRGAVRPACGRCASCQLIAARTHPDLQMLIPEALQQALGWSEAEFPADGEGAKARAKPSRDIRVQAVRQAIDFAHQTSSRGGPRVVVMHPAERMNATSASALLKTLEEPPPAVRLILVSSAPQRLLPTVRSRCQSLRLPLPDPAVAAGWLATQGASEPELLLAAAGGQPLDALERLSQGLDAAAWRALPGEVLAGRSALLSGWPLPLVVDALQKLCVDAQRVAVGASPRCFPMDALPRAGDPERLGACWRELQAAARHSEHPWNATLAVEALVQRLQRALQPTRPVARAA